MPRAYFEKIPVSSGSSLSTLHRRLDDAIAFQWHHHPEYELTLTLNSLGQRFIGEHVGDYAHGDLVLVGPNLPHAWASRTKIHGQAPHVSLVIWFRQAWIDAFLGTSVEFVAIQTLFARANTGLAFGSEIGLSLADAFEQALTSSPSERLIAVLGILLKLAEQPHPERLSSSAPICWTDDRSRIHRVLQHLHQQYSRVIKMDELAKLAALSKSGLHRMFVKHTNATVSGYVTRLRVGEACARLSASDEPLAQIASEVGFANSPIFNRQFRKLRGMSPKEYRASYRK
ncbi:AraC family transcriptional regulator [Pararhizobium sp.]|uniref:AraC family transcriptional regulator n=1 Tax=Pararhizobium sp. TaxID=1977563 RepID=UPI002726AAD0|nr:AraC family transcriptional regulator [Pararhizobium sp.]MDO9415554.1 AraC family transcriptional regulator [Pararhizobium sp.]